jgi:hypothetical protein
MKISITRLCAFSGDSPELHTYEKDFFASHVSFMVAVHTGEPVDPMPAAAMFEIPERLPGTRALPLVRELLDNLPGPKAHVQAVASNLRKIATYYKDGSVVFKEEDFDCAMCTSTECPAHFREYIRMTVN